MRDLAALVFVLFIIIGVAVFFSERPQPKQEYNPNDWRQRYDRKTPARYTPIESKPAVSPTPTPTPTQ